MLFTVTSRRTGRRPVRFALADNARRSRTPRNPTKQETIMVLANVVAAALLVAAGAQGALARGGHHYAHYPKVSERQ